MIFFDINGTLLDYDYAEREGILDFFRNNPYLFSFAEQQAGENKKDYVSNRCFYRQKTDDSFLAIKRINLIILYL